MLRKSQKSQKSQPPSNNNSPANVKPFLIGPQFMGWMGGLGKGLGF
jgi:predicted lipid-binding transport protein (Tim44 family)